MGENKDMTNEELKTENSAAMADKLEAAASLLNMIVRTENDHDFKEVYELLEQNDEWIQTKGYIDTKFEELRKYIVLLSCDPEKRMHVDELEEGVSDMQYLFGSACFLAGLRKGLLLKQWASGEIKINPRDMVL